MPRFARTGDPKGTGLGNGSSPFPLKPPHSSILIGIYSLLTKMGENIGNFGFRAVEAGIFIDTSQFAGLRSQTRGDFPLRCWRFL